jgi:iron-sulfur cluster insertion protein
MKLLTFLVSERAVNLYKEEMGLQNGDALRLFVRFLGSSASGFTLGVVKDVPNEEDIVKTYGGILFVVRPDDHWFVKDMSLDYDPVKDKIIAEFPSIS